MLLRVRLKVGPVVRPRKSGNRNLALALGALLTPVTFSAFALAAWRITSDLRWTEEFAIEHGVFSHWQVWIAMAAVLQTASILLNRYGRRGDALSVVSMTTPSRHHGESGASGA